MTLPPIWALSISAIELLGRACMVSVETMKIVKEMPE